MAFNDLERKRVEHAVSGYIDLHRPPRHLRSQLDLGFRIAGQSVEIFEIRPAWSDPGQTMTHNIARATYVRGREVWKVYWWRQDSRWHAYAPHPLTSSIDEFLALVDGDEYHCFRG